jgi:hypothetical protein
MIKKAHVFPVDTFSARGRWRKCGYTVGQSGAERSKTYGPDKQKVTVLWPLTLNCDLDLEVRVMKAVRNTPSSDGACVYEVSSNYLERMRRYGPDKQNVTIFDRWPW